MGNLEQTMKDECLANIDSKEAWKCALDMEDESENVTEEIEKTMEEE